MNSLTSSRMKRPWLTDKCSKSMIMIIADTGFWIAQADGKEEYRKLTNQAFQSYNENLITI